MEAFNLLAFQVKQAEVKDGILHLIIYAQGDKSKTWYETQVEVPLESFKSMQPAILSWVGEYGLCEQCSEQPAEEDGLCKQCKEPEGAATDE